jgi:hypothetical protein
MLFLTSKPAAPDPVTTRIARANIAISLWTVLVDQVTASITAEFQAAEIKSILLKGPAFGRLLYDDAVERSYTDTDLLVRSIDREQAERSLQTCGFVRVDRDEDWMGPAPKYAHTFQRPTDGAMVDLHWRLSGAAATPEEVWSAVSEHIVALEVGGRLVSGLDAAATAVLVALHNAHHGNSRPQTLIDLDRAVERLDMESWREAAGLAIQLQATEPFTAGLRLTHAGDALADQLGLGRPASVEMWLKTNPSTYGAWVLDRLAQTRTLRGRLQICLQVIVPPPVVMHTFFPFARRGRAALAFSYVLRPLRLSVHAGPAMRDWIRARRTVRAGRRSRH